MSSCQNMALAGRPALAGAWPVAECATGSVFGTPFVLAGFAIAAAATKAVASSMPRKIACNSGRASCRSLLEGTDFLVFWLSTRAMVKISQVRAVVLRFLSVCLRLSAGQILKQSAGQQTGNGNHGQERDHRQHQ